MKYFSLNFEDVGLQYMTRFSAEHCVCNESVIEWFRKGEIVSCCRPEYLPTLRRVVELVVGIPIQIPHTEIQAGGFWRHKDIIILPRIKGISFRYGTEIDHLDPDKIRRGHIEGFIYRKVMYRKPRETKSA